MESLARILAPFPVETALVIEIGLRRITDAEEVVARLASDPRVARSPAASRAS